MAKAIVEAVRLSLLYFTAVFLVGMLLGSLRVKLLQPHLGTRYAEICEMPIMLIWVWQAAEFTLWQLGEDRHNRTTSTTPILISGFELVFLIIAELARTAIQQKDWSNACKTYFAGRDMVAGPAYGLAVVAYALMPWYIWNFQIEDEDPTIWEVNVDEGDYFCDR